ALDPAIRPTSPVSAFNRSVYRRLKVALGLNLRRQVFLAVCDDLTVRNWLAAQLHAELAWPRRDRSPKNGSPSSIDLPDYPRLVSLWLDLQNPNPIAQVALWMEQHPPPDLIAVRPPEFQIIGVERLTHYPASVQQSFLNQLQHSDRAIAALDSALVLWLPRPWLCAIRQSAPALWNCHTALFEFEGDPGLGAAIETSKTSNLLLPSPRSQFNGQHEKSASAEEVVALVVPQSRSIALTEPEESEDWQQRTESLNGKAKATSEELIVADTIAEDMIAVVEPGGSVLPTAAIAFSEAATLPEIALSRSISPDDEFLRTRPEIAAALEEIEQLSPQTDHVVVAQAYRRLGDRLRDRVTQGDTAEQTLLLTIQAYEQALVWSEEGAAVQRAEIEWAEVLNDIGNLYWMLSRQTSQAELRLPYLEQAIVAYQLAATKSDRQTQPHIYALVQNNLGSVYGDLAQHRDPAEALQQSAAAYEETLHYRTLEADPDRHAATQNNLGTTYWNLAQHQQPSQNLLKAIAAYQSALRYYSPTCEPLHYAMLQNNLGTAFWNLAQHPTEHSPIDWLQQAIAAYQAALVYRTLEAMPTAYAATQNNLGTAFWHLATSEVPSSDRLAYLDQAIAAYSDCLGAVQSLTNPAELTFDPIAARNQLGLAYHRRAETSTSAEATQRADLEAALDHHLQALEGWKHNVDLSETAFQAIVRTVKTFYTNLGLKGQNAALSKVPAHLLPRLMRQL
ncbi:MAG TPA: hypothetical protein V6D18_19245, partial [Thermosynechococcaceae cyanobacterium]